MGQNKKELKKKGRKEERKTLFYDILKFIS